jgi:arsenic resistance protein ArsH
MEELMKFTLLVRDRSDYLVDRYSERREVLQKSKAIGAVNLENM